MVLTPMDPVPQIAMWTENLDADIDCTARDNAAPDPNAPAVKPDSIQRAHGRRDALEHKRPQHPEFARIRSIRAG